MASAEELGKALKFLSPEEAARIIIHRFQDLYFCNKEDLCNIKALGIEHIIDDIIYEYEELSATR